MVTPFFSIGVTTYDRPALLREALLSILGQSFQDYEVLVGNDLPGHDLSGSDLGIADERIRFINYSSNLGEMRNMNTLLAVSRGRYFTWLADDDLYAVNFLGNVHAALVQHDFPACVFTSFARGKTFQDQRQSGDANVEVYAGSRFLHLYLSRKLRAVGCYGVFERDYIIRSGGMQQLGDSFSPYSDNLLVIKAGLLKNVVYIHAPLVFYRTHEGSISYTSADAGTFRSAQEDLCRHSLEIFISEGLRDAFPYNLHLLLKWCARDFVTVALRGQVLRGREVVAYLRFLQGYLRRLRGTRYYWWTVAMLVKAGLRLCLNMGRARMRA